MRILFLEDDELLSELVAAYLSSYFTVDAVYSFEEASDYIDQFHYDMVLLDRDINNQDVGMDLIERVKTKDNATGVIVISAFDSVSDKIKGLSLGADDYIDKPFDNDELLARIYAISRRNMRVPLVNIDGIQCNLSNTTISYDGKDVPLTRKESDLFFYLLQRRGKIVSKDELLDALYLNPQNVTSNTIDVTLAHIRKKLPVNIIKTVKTRGYVIQ